MSAPTPRELAAALGQRKGARIQVSPPEERTAEGIVFQSKREMDFWLHFRGMEKCGAVTELQRQVRYPLHAITPAGMKVRITEYRADIVCRDRDGKLCIYDPKGQRTEIYKIKARWMEAEYGIRIVEL